MSAQDTLVLVPAMLGSLLLGGLLTAAFGFRHFDQRGYQRGTEAQALLDWPGLLDAAGALPRQWGTLHEHRRRPMGWGEVTNAGLVPARSIEPGRHRAPRQFRITGVFAALSAPRRFPLANPDWRTDVAEIPARELAEVGS
jgi:hypothetical protein